MPTQSTFFLLPFTLPNLQIENRKIDLNVASKVGSLDNVKHRPGGGDKKVFNDVEYLKQMNETTGATLMAKSSGQTSQSSSRRESAVQVCFFFQKKEKELYIFPNKIVCVDGVSINQYSSENKQKFSKHSRKLSIVKHQSMHFQINVVELKSNFIKSDQVTHCFYN